MSARRSLNLARRGFSNLRPHRRAAVLLIVVGLGLLAVNAYLYGRYQTGSAEIRRELRDIEAQIEAELRILEELERALLQLDLESQNEQVSFLNERIAERTFPWSRLFDRLEEVLPSQVRLSSLTPSTGNRARRSRQRSSPDGAVALSIAGESQGDSAIVTFVDRLFEHPSFGSPNLAQENRDGATVRFQLNVDYLPGALAPSEQGLVPDEQVTGYAPSEGSETPPQAGAQPSEPPTGMRAAAGQESRELAGTPAAEEGWPSPPAAAGAETDERRFGPGTTLGRAETSAGSAETTLPPAASRATPDRTSASPSTPSPSRPTFGARTGRNGGLPPSRGDTGAGRSSESFAPRPTASAAPRFRGEG